MRNFNTNPLPFYVLILLLILVPFGQLTRFSAFPSVPISLLDIGIGVFIIVSFIWHWVTKRCMYAPSHQEIIILFSGALIFSLILHINQFQFNELFFGGLYTVRWIAYACTYTHVYSLTKHHVLSTRIVRMGLLYAGVVSGIFGLVQYVIYPNLRNLLYLGWDPHEYRVFGTFFDSGFLGIVLVLTLILITQLLRDYGRRYRAMLYFLGIVTYIALALTYSRSSYLACIAAFAVISIMRKSWRPIVAVIVLLGITLPILPRPSQTSEAVKLERTSTIRARASNYTEAREIITANPVFGVGFNMLRYYKRDNNLIPYNEWDTNHAAAGLDNSLLFLWATTGIVGLSVYISFWASVLSQYIQERSTIVIGSITAVFVHSFFNNTLFYPWVMVWIWLLLAVSNSSSNYRNVTRSVFSVNLKCIFSFLQRDRL